MEWGGFPTSAMLPDTVRMWIPNPPGPPLASLGGAPVGGFGLHSPVSG